eukprot:CAMPEP_0114972814 /NCGR_PEP_ID=MMETSP0216-20121206/603_1 /TAXON_ID=223996 /ORGANISM="Protocruzia adherens, Strain Boccale" /LENGTH=177 /DNA_ID=CAMNT_0002333227 /DNA_START=39 /DNA_END=572 /DNA_ORIENTATION=+
MEQHNGDKIKNKLKILLFGVEDSPLFFNFPHEKSSASGVDGIISPTEAFTSYVINISSNTIKLLFWDLRGNPCDDYFYRTYTRFAAVVCLMFDVMNVDGVGDLLVSMKNIERIVDDGTQIVLIGIRSEYGAERGISRRRGENLAKSYGGMYFDMAVGENSRFSEFMVLLARNWLTGL